MPDPDNLTRMVLALGVAMAWLRPVEFPADPPGRELSRGAAIFRSGVGIDRTTAEDRRPIGWWFDGRVQRASEHALWISPSLVARRLGYLEAKERWPRGEVNRRWTSLRATLAGHAHFLVELRALPRQDPFGMGWSGPPGLEQAENVRFLVGWQTAQRVAVQVPDDTGPPPSAPLMWVTDHEATPVSHSVGEFQREDWRQLPTVDWARDPRLARHLIGEFEPSTAENEPGWRGAAYSRWYWLTLPIPDGMDPSRGYTLRILSRAKERVAHFGIVLSPLKPGPRRSPEAQ